VKEFGGIDILVNNASAIYLTGTLNTPLKSYDLMHNINTRGTYLTTQICLPYLLKSSNPHILNISPPLSMHSKWFKDHVAYTIAKYGMSLCVLGMAEEFREQGVAVNALWPLTSVATAAVQNKLSVLMDSSRTSEIMGDAAYCIFTSNSRQCTGNFFLDEEVLRLNGVTNFDKYRYNPNYKGGLTIDFFIEDELIERVTRMTKPKL